MSELVTNGPTDRGLKAKVLIGKMPKGDVTGRRPVATSIGVLCWSDLSKQLRRGQINGVQLRNAMPMVKMLQKTTKYETCGATRSKFRIIRHLSRLCTTKTSAGRRCREVWGGDSCLRRIGPHSYHPPHTADLSQRRPGAKRHNRTVQEENTM